MCNAIRCEAVVLNKTGGILSELFPSVLVFRRSKELIIETIFGRPLLLLPPASRSRFLYGMNGSL